MSLGLRTVQQLADQDFECETRFLPVIAIRPPCQNLLTDKGFQM